MKGIPFSVGRFLQDAIARVRRIYLIRGIAAVGIVWVLGIVAVMAVDSRFVIFDDRIRWAMTAGVWLLALAAAMWAIVRPLRRRLDFRRMAAILDNRHPEQEERLSTLVELSESEAAKAGFSVALFALVGNLAEGDVAKLDLKREFPVFGAGRRFGVFALMALALILGAAVSPNLVGRLFIRAVAPWSDIGNLFSDEISVKPGDITILSGSVIHIAATRNESSAVRLPTATTTFSIRLSRKTPHGWSEETSEAMSGGVYETTADLNEREWRYRVTAGHAVTRYYYVRVSQMPKYDLFTATVDYPAYTHLQPLVLSNAEVGAITAIQGSHVRFDVRVSDPGTLADFRIGKEPLLEHTMVSNRTVAWSLDLVNADGFRAEKGKHPLKSFIDQPPTVVIEKPTGTLRLPPHATIPVEITATDDIAIEEAYFRVSIDNEPWARHFPTKIDLAGDRRLLRTVADVDLSFYDLIFAKNIRFDLVVSDGCPPEFGGPHSATSMPFTVQFAADVSNYAMQELKQEVDDARRDIDEARKRLNDAQNLARQVRDELRRNEKVPESTEQKGERLAHELDEAAKRVEEMRNDFLADERFAPLTRPLDRMLEEDVKPALTEVENAQFRDREERADAVDAAIPEMAKAVQELDELKKRLDERAAKVDAFEKARDLAARQEALAKAAAELTRERPLDTAKLEAWKRLEEAAMRKADELARQDPDSDVSEAKRKMETAAREMVRLKEKLEAAVAESNRLAKAEQDLQKTLANLTNRVDRQAIENIDRKLQSGLLQQRTNELAKASEAQKKAQEALDAVAATRAAAAEERRRDVSPLDPKSQSSLAEKTKAATKAAKAAVEAQKQADDFLRRGEATEGTKAMQQLADKAAEASQKAPHDVDRAARAADAQRDAAKALEEEKALREAMAKGERTAADLEAFDRATQAAAKERSAAFDRAERAAAERDKEASNANNRESGDLNQAVSDQRRAADAIRQAASRRADESRARTANNPNVSEAKAREARNFERVAAEAQRSAEDRLERSGATEGVKAMQQLATVAARNARKAPQTKEKFDLAEAAQKAATEALQNELKIREGIRRGEMTEADLAALDAQLKAGLLKVAAERTEAAKAAAEEAIRKARDAVGSEEDERLGQLADAALEAARDAVSSQLSESKLRDDNAQAVQLRDAEDALDAITADAADEQSVEASIRRLQQSAAEALARNDRGRALTLQKDIARAQARATDSVNEEDEVAARAVANEAQGEAAEAVEKAYHGWNNDTKAQAVAAQKEAIEKELAAQSEARTIRALAKLSAAEKAISTPSAPSDDQTIEQSGQSDNSLPSEAAEAASDAMDREVNAQAAALGMSRRKSEAGSAKGRGKKESSSGGGDLSDEVSDLAKELKRNDGPGFMKSLFSRFGWFKLRGLSGDGIGTQDLKDVPREYRDLVRRYFLKLSEETP